MTTYHRVLDTICDSAEPVDANEATLTDCEAAETVMPDLQYLCNEMACADAPLRMIPFLTPAARNEVEQIKAMLERLASIRTTDAMGFTYQLASLLHYLETHTQLARQNYQWCAAVMERACLTDTDYRDMRRRVATYHVDGWDTSTACNTYFTMRKQSLTFKDMHALEKMCPYMIELAEKVFSQYNEWI